MSLGSNAATATRPSTRSAAIVRDGVVAGLIGGITVALFFGVVDALHGQPLHSPSMLGQAIFMDVPPAQAEGVHPLLVLAYTTLHLAGFVAVGLAAAALVAQFEKNPPLGALLLLLFVGFEAGLLTLTAAFAPDVIRTLGAGKVATANALAALAMAAYFWRTHPDAGRSLKRWLGVDD